MANLSPVVRYTIIGVGLLLVGLCVVVGFLAIFMPSSPIHISFGSTSAPLPVAPTAVVQNPSTQSVSPTEAPTFTPLATYTLAPTYTPVPTYTPQPTYTLVPTQPQEAMFTPNQPVFCRAGPSEVVWWDPQEALNEGQTVKIIGKSTYEWGLWWYIQKASGTRCWVYSELGSTTGNVAGVPEKSAPATPVPAYVDVYIINNHGVKLCAMWIANAGKGDWVDLLSDFNLAAGDTLYFTAFPGRFDIEIYDCLGNLVDATYDFKINSKHRYFSTP